MNYQEIIQIINQTLSMDSLQNPYLLLDCSQMSKIQRHSLSSYEGIPIWRNVLKMEDETISPILLDLDRRDFARQVKQICEKKQNVPLYSIIISYLPTAKLAEHLGQYSLCQAQDKQPLVLRFCDTRILPILEQALSNENRRHFFAPITKWFYPDIVGEWHMIENQCMEDVPKLKGILELTDTEYEDILDGTIPYALFMEVYEHLTQLGNINGSFQSNLWRDIQLEAAKEDFASPFFSMHEFIERYLQSLSDKLKIWGTDDTVLMSRFDYQETV